MMITFSNLTDWQIFGSINGFNVFIVLFVLFVALSLVDFRRFYGLQKGQYIFTPLLLFFFWWFFRSIFSMIKPPFYNTELWQWIILFILFTNYISQDTRIGYKALLGYSISAIVILLLYYSGTNALYTEGRLTVFELTNPNTLGNISANALLIIIFFVSKDVLVWGKMRFLLLLVIPGLLDVLIKTGSRGALICFCFGIICLLLFSKIKLKWKIYGTGVLLLLSTVAISYLLSSDIFKMRWIDADLSRLGGRSPLWTVSLKLFFEKPIIGYGDGGLQDAIWIYFYGDKDPHNLYLVLLVTSGLIGFFLFMIFLYRIYKLTLLNIRSQKNVFCFVLLIVSILASFKQGSALNGLGTWTILAIIAGLSSAINSEKEEMDVIKNDSI